MVTGIVLAILLVVFAFVAEATFLMLAVGIAHNDWWLAMPPMGFGTAFAMTVCLDFFLTLIIVAAVRIANEK